MAKNNDATPKYPMLSAKIEAANKRRETLKAMGTQNIAPTSYYSPTFEQAEELLVALMADADWSNELAQEESGKDTFFVFRKRNLAAGEQPTIIRCAFNLDVNDLVLTVTGTSIPSGFSLDGVKPQEAIAAEKATVKRKAAAKDDRKRAAFQARLGF
jgi:hypothetical protein